MRCMSVRRLLFVAVYYGFLPVGHAQARLAEAFRRTGVGLGWPLLVLWWPLRQIYALGFKLCLGLRPRVSSAADRTVIR
jgi:hypothetical protein